MMKKLINFLLVLAIGAILGYIFHNPIDVKLKEKFGADKVEATRAIAEEKLTDVGEKTVVVGKAMVEAGKEAVVDSSNQK